MRHLLLFWLFFSSLALSAETESKNFAKLVDDIWQFEVHTSPLLATSEGVEGYNHLLPDLSADNLKHLHDKRLAYFAQLEAIDQSNLTREEQITLHMQKYRLKNAISEYQFNAHWVPITSEYGFHSAIAGLPNTMPFKQVEDYDNYIARLAALETYFAQNIAWMKKGLAANYTQPKAVLVGYEDSITPYLVANPQDSSFYTPFTRFPHHFSEEQKQTLIQQGKSVINEVVTPAYQAFYDFMTTEYMPGARDNIAARNWPDGEAYYRNRAEHYTTTAMTPEDIHKLGLEEVKRIRQDMQDIIDSLQFEGSFADFIHFLRTDPQFYAKTEEELIQTASYIAKKMDAKLPALFSYLPRTPYGVAPVPASIAPKYTTGRYISPRRDDQPGYYWVNTYALDKRPLYALPALTLHEAVPGHHLQISLASEMTNLPKVRQNTYISAFGEGWGLYSEYLGIEAGMYTDPYDDFGRLSYEMWRACRLVVDTGMHMFGWSRQKALNFMLENTALSEHNVKTEIDRYISWPAQALSYKIGEIKIKSLRKRSESELGANFDIRAFHKAVLAHGSVPLFILEQNIDDYIQSNKTAD